MQLVKRFWLLAILQLLLSGISFASFTCNGHTYARRYKLVVAKQNVTATLTNFPILTCFNALCAQADNYTILPDLRDTGHSGYVNNTVANSAGRTNPADVEICDAPTGGSAVKYEGLGYNGTTGAWEVHRQQTLTTSADGGQWLFIGDAALSTNSEDLSMWSDAFYNWVLHDPSDGIDSVGCLGSVTTTGTVNSVTGLVGGGASFSSSRKNFAHASCMNMTTGFTLENLYKPTTNPGVCFTQDKGDSGSGTQVLIGCQGATPWCEYYDGSDHLVLTGSFTTGVWQHHSCTYNGTTMTSYLNGTSLGTLSYTNASLTTNSNPLGVGGRNTAGNGIDGSLDEVRGSTVARSAAWDAATTFTLLYPAGFTIVLDANEPAGLSAGANCVPVPVPHANVPSNQTDFQMLFRGAYPWMATVANGGYRVNGNGCKDARWFSDSACTTPATFERVACDDTTGDTAFRVLLPALSSSTDTTPYLKLGDSADTTDLSAPSTTWTGYVASYNLGSAGSLSLNDSSATGLTLATCGANNVAPAISPLGGAAYIPDNSCLNNVGAANVCALGLPCGSSAGTITSWARPGPSTNAANCGSGCVAFGYGVANGTGARDISFSRYSSPAQCAGMSALASNCIGTNSGLSIDTAIGTPLINALRSWVRFDFVYPSGAQMNSGSPKAQLYVNGVLATSGGGLYDEGRPTDVLNTGTGEINIGRAASHGVAWCLTCMITGVRVSTGLLSQDRITTEVLNEKGTYLFYGLGTATPFSGGGATVQPVLTIITQLGKRSYPLRAR